MNCVVRFVNQLAMDAFATADSLSPLRVPERGGQRAVFYVMSEPTGNGQRYGGDKIRTVWYWCNYRFSGA